MRQLAAKMAPMLNIEATEAEKRIKDLFSLTSRLLANGEPVDIDRLGQFIPRDGQLTFVPDSALAQAVNAPFAPFAPVEIAADIDTDTLDDDTEFQPQPEPEPEPETLSEPDTEFQPQPEPEPETQPEPDTLSEPEPKPVLQFPQDEEEYFVPDSVPVKKSGFPTWIWILFAFLVGAAFGFGAFFYCTSLGWL